MDQVERPNNRAPVACTATELVRHVLFPTDFSEISERALEYVERLAPKGVGQVTLLNALDVPGEEAYPPGYQELAEGAARDLWSNGKTPFEAGIPVVIETVLIPGHPLPAILEVLKSQDISLIVMGTQGKGFIQEIFSGQCGP